MVAGVEVRHYEKACPGCFVPDLCQRARRCRYESDLKRHFECSVTPVRAPYRLEAKP